MRKEKYKITGMTCAACVSAVERAAASLQGVKSAQVNLLTSSLAIEYDESKVNQRAIIKAIKQKGYGAEIFSEFSRENEMKKNLRNMKIRIAVSVVFMLAVMYVGMGKMLHLPMPGILDNMVINGALQFAFALPVFIVNYKYFTVGFKRIAHLDPNMDSLIATGSGASLVYSIYAYIKIIMGVGHGEYHLYVDSAAMILTLITVGKFLEMRAKQQTSKALHGIEQLSPEYANVIRDGKEAKIPTSELEMGDIVIVRPGENLPADGIVTKGSGSINCAVITGESLPVDIKEGSLVSAGTTNLNSPFEFKVTTTGSQTTLGKMIALVEDAVAGKAPIARLADKVSAVFVPVVIAIALISAVTWFFVTQDIERALSIGVSVLVIACPCSLGLATPTAIMAGTGKGAEYGVLFRSAEALETLCKADTVILDKTGTVTEGKLEVVHVIPYNCSENELLSIASALECRSEHPIATAICKQAEEEKTNIPEGVNIEAIPGYGIKGIVNGDEYHIGNAGITEKAEFSTDALRLIDSLENSGQTVIRIIKRQKESFIPIGIIALSDKIRADSKRAIEYINSLGITTVMLTGDNQGAARSVAETVKISSFTAGAKPQDKESVVRELKESGHTVVMIGDGVNDAPALARADIGVAIGSGTDIAIENSDVVLIGGRLTDFCNAVKVSRSTMRVIKQNLFWAFFYNCIGIGLAVAGIATPMIAAAAMSLSSVSVVSNALRLRFVKLIKSNEAAHVITGAKNANNNINNTERKESEMNTISKEMIINGMNCSHCSARVEAALNAVGGVRATVDLEKKTAYIECPENISNEYLTKTVTDAGYKVVSIK